MSKRRFLIILTTVCCFAWLFSCKKTAQPTGDQTINYFPVKLGKWVSYNVDSTVYYGGYRFDTTIEGGVPVIDTVLICQQYESRTQLKYAISDTFRDKQFRLSYIMDVYFRANDGGQWMKSGVILMTPADIILTTTAPPPGTPVTNLLYNQGGVQFIKMVYPIQEGLTWAGNANIDVKDPPLNWYKNWNYKYMDVDKSFNNGMVNYEKTVTVLENDESVNYPHLDSATAAYRIYAKEVYAWNVGMVYKELTHWDYIPFTQKCVNGYSVVMRAIDHN